MSGIVWLASYPKSGNTWLRAVLQNLEQGEGAPASINALGGSGFAQTRRALDDLLGFDSGDCLPGVTASLRPVSQVYAARGLERPSHQKIHDACHRTASGEWIVSEVATAGAIYLVRNPLDVAISFAHHADCSVDEAIRRMADPGHCLAGEDGAGLKMQVEQRLLTWSAHVTSWVDDAPFPCTVLRYEDMAARPLETFAKAATALHLRCDEAALARAIDNASFARLQAQEDAEPFAERDQRSARFFRRGKVGDWRDTLSAAQVDAIAASHGKVMRRFGYLDADGTPRAM